jgi:branched-chain amino acid transport system permease protein
MTIAFGRVVYTFVGSTDSLTNGFTGIINIPPVKIFGYALKNRTDYFYFVLFITVIALIAKNHILKSRTGRALRAIKGNIYAANSNGINIYKYKTMAFVISGLYTGFAGALYAHLVRYISPDTFEHYQSVFFMTILLFGGLGSFWGPIIGSILLTLSQNALQPLAIYQQLVYGFLIIFILFFMPNGVNGIFEKIKNKTVKRKSDYAEIKASNS